jgi:hypothetical protein
MAMNDNAKNRRRLARVVVAAALALTLGGCDTSGSTQDRVGRLMVAPDKFVLYSCPQLEQRAKGVASRQKELAQLMAKAGTTPDGRIISALAYQEEYTETVADLNELRRAAASKDCKPIAALARTAAPAR